MTLQLGSRPKNEPKRESEPEHFGSTFGTLELDFIFVPKLRLLKDGLYLIRKKQKKLWEDIRSIDRCDAGIWLLLRPGWLGSYVYFRSGGSLWISSRIVRKDQPLTPRRSVWTVWRTKDYDFLMDEVLSHIKSTDVSVYAPGPKTRSYSRDYEAGAVPRSSRTDVFRSDRIARALEAASAARIRPAERPSSRMKE